ncbi:hypothetical protein [Steroidobacter cummioxidans]|uniref:hypothetical protein n=1 Tax=Steroidobacter cummioxidans TaxID=1803913 RepID=UPI000E322C1C|nr:hypothetical protein [Steroidobacter cummioxidans]
MPGSDPVTQRAAAAVQEYIVKSKHWEKNRFEVPFNRKEGTALVFWVLYADDDASTAPGGGESLVVYFDPVSNRVVKELGFQ